MTSWRTGPAPGREGRTGHTRMTHRGPLTSSEVSSAAGVVCVQLVEQGDRPGQVGVAGGLGQQAGEPSVAQLAAERRQAAKVEVSMRDGEAEPETHPPAGQMTGRGQPGFA